MRALLPGCGGWLVEFNFGKLFGEPNLMIRNLKQEAGEITTLDGSPLDFGALSCRWLRRCFLPVDLGCWLFGVKLATAF